MAHWTVFNTAVISSTGPPTQTDTVSHRKMTWTVPWRFWSLLHGRTDPAADTAAASIMSASTAQDVLAAPPPDSAGTVTAADGAYLHQLQQELRQLAIHQAVVDDLSFAYQLQLEEVLQASAGRPGMDVSARMFAPESEECLQRRAAVDAQVSQCCSPGLTSPTTC